MLFQVLNLFLALLLNAFSDAPLEESETNLQSNNIKTNGIERLKKLLRGKNMLVLQVGECK